ncbi:MAG: hypothetical protein V7767_00710 [Leeuwenhoekiella sp.]
MNRIEIQAGGFPFDADTLLFMQSMIQNNHKLAQLGGDNYILSGAVVNGSNVSNGFVVIGGELLPLVGGAVKANLTVVESVENASYLEDNNNDGQGDSKLAEVTRTATFTAGAGQVAWANMKRINPLVEVQKAVVPLGGIIMWSGAINAIPAGWKLCDGQNGTPDLSGKFIVGYDAADPDYNAVGKNGGTRAVTLTEQQMPSHNHNGNVSIPPHKHTLPGNVIGASGNGSNALTNKNNTGSTIVNETGSSGYQQASLTTISKGGGQSHENRPPYFTLAYIKYVG